MMFEYLIRYRPDAAGVDAETVYAYRVEAWKTAFAFFCDPRNLKNPTTLVPLDLVRSVELKQEVPQAEGYPVPVEHYEPDDLRTCKDFLRGWIETDISRWLGTDEIWKSYEENTRENRGKLNLRFSSGYVYSISFRPKETFKEQPGEPVAEDNPSYIGCIVHGPDGRGNDLPDGRFLYATWLAILQDIVSYELRASYDGRRTPKVERPSLQEPMPEVKTPQTE